MEKKNNYIIDFCIGGGVLFSLNNNVYADDVSDFNSFRDKLIAGTSVVLKNDIEVTEPIEIGEGNITIDVNGYNLKCTNESSNVGGNNGAMLKITHQNTNLTITNSGNVQSGFLNEDSTDCRALYFDNKAIGNTYTIEKVTFKNFYLSSEKGGAIYFGGADRILGKSDNITLKNNKFVGNSASSGGAIYFDTALLDTNLIMNNNTFEENTVTCTGTSIALNGQGGALYFDKGYTAVLSNNTFNGNEAKTGKSFGGGYITGAASGGAIYAYATSGYQLENNKFIKNKADRDGGAMVIYDDSNYRPLSISGKETLFQKNVSGKRGGAIHIYNANNAISDAALELTEGTFEENEAGEDGGAINYTQGSRGYLKLKNALITGNKAVVGGGIWLCPTGLLQTYSTLGGAIYGNTATGSFDRDGNIHVDARGNEIRYSVKDADDAFSTGGSDETHYVTISPRNHEGKIVDWYADEAAHRYRAGDSPVNISDYKNRTTEFSLTRNDNDYFEGADVIFINNTAGMRGGAIATNWTLIIGEPEDMDITVNKAFVKEGQPYNDPNKIADNLKIYINLYRIDANGKRFLLDKNVELNKGNNFTYTFTDLPTKYNDEEGNLQTYSYEVKEVDEKNQVSNTCTSLNSEKRTCTITNEYVAPPVDFVPSVEKKVTGKTKPKKDASFTFEISSEEQDGVELPKNTKVTVKGEGRVNFGNIKITKAGEYNFTIKEVIGNNLDYKYDLSVWMVKVVVGENTENGTLYIDSIKYYKKNKEYEKVVFENEYNPSTGDPLLSNVSNLIISGFVILGISMIKRKIYN